MSSSWVSSFLKFPIMNVRFGTRMYTNFMSVMRQNPEGLLNSLDGSTLTHTLVLEIMVTQPTLTWVLATLMTLVNSSISPMLLCATFPSPPKTNIPCLNTERSWLCSMKWVMVFTVLWVRQHIHVPMVLEYSGTLWRLLLKCWSSGLGTRNS